MPTFEAVAKFAEVPPYVELTLVVEQAGDVTLTRRDPDKARPVRGAEPVTVPAGQPVTIPDYEAPFGVPLIYEAAVSGLPGVVSSVVQLDPTSWYPNDQGWSTERGAVWLKHLTIPSLSMAIDLSDASSPATAQTRSVAAVLNRNTPIVLADGVRKAPTTTLQIRTWSLEEGERLTALLADNSILLLDVPAAERWGITHWYVAVGDVTEERLVQEWAPFPYRVWSLPCEIVDRPPGGVTYPSCCYYTEQKGLVSYLEWAGKRGSYAEMASCGVGGGGDDGDEQIVAAVYRHGTATYGTTTTTSAPSATRSFMTDASTSNTYDTVPYPAVIVTKTVTLTAGQVYEVDGDIHTITANNDATLTLTARVTPGSSATATSGTFLGGTNSRVSSAGDWISVMYLNPGQTFPQFTAPTSGPYTFALVLTGSTGNFSTIPGNGPSAGYMALYQRPVVTTTTTTPGDTFYLSTPVTLSSLHHYYVTCADFVKANQQIAMDVRLYPGTPTPTPDTGTSVATSATSATPTEVVQLLTLTDDPGFSPPSTGTYTIAARIFSTGPWTDCSGAINPDSNDLYGDAALTVYQAAD